MLRPPRLQVLVLNTLPLAVALSLDDIPSHYTAGHFNVLARQLSGSWLDYGFQVGADVCLVDHTTTQLHDYTITTTLLPCYTATLFHYYTITLLHYGFQVGANVCLVGLYNAAALTAERSLFFLVNEHFSSRIEAVAARSRQGALRRDAALAWLLSTSQVPRAMRNAPRHAPRDAPRVGDARDSHSRPRRDGPNPIRFRGNGRLFL